VVVLLVDDDVRLSSAGGLLVVVDELLPLIREAHRARSRGSRWGTRATSGRAERDDVAHDRSAGLLGGELERNGTIPIISSGISTSCIVVRSPS